MAPVFRRMFFFPAGSKVERQVLQLRDSEGAVRQPIKGRLDEVPVPLKINSSMSKEEKVR